jgi:hypothetical protein
MTIDKLPALNNPHQTLPTYRVEAGAASLMHVPASIPFARAWNRAEYDITEITYRVYCCPTWAGNSGHAAEALQHYISILGAKAPAHTAQTIAASLFIFWRLYYDRRITPVHTLVDTFEATFNVGVGGADAAEPSDLDAPVNASLDAWGFIQRSSKTGDRKISSVDPIRLMSLLVQEIGGGKRWPEVSTMLQGQLETGRALATQVGRYVIPRWSHGQDPRLARAWSIPTVNKPAKL